MVVWGVGALWWCGGVGALWWCEKVGVLWWCEEVGALWWCDRCEMKSFCSGEERCGGWKMIVMASVKLEMEMMENCMLNSVGSILEKFGVE